MIFYLKKLINDKFAFIFEIHVSNESLKRFRFRIEKYNYQTQVKLYFVNFSFFYKFTHSLFLKDAMHVKHFYSANGAEMDQVYKQYINPFLDAKIYKFHSVLPDDFKRGSKMLQIVNIYSF